MVVLHCGEMFVQQVWALVLTWLENVCLYPMCRGFSQFPGGDLLEAALGAPGRARLSHPPATNSWCTEIGVSFALVAPSFPPGFYIPLVYGREVKPRAAPLPELLPELQAEISAPWTKLSPRSLFRGQGMKCRPPNSLFLWFLCFFSSLSVL